MPDAAQIAPPATVAILGMGAMGAGLAAELSAAGFRVVTDLSGRSEASRARASAAGAEDAGSIEALAAGADLFLSVVPADQAEPLAARLAAALSARTAGRPLHFVEANAIAASRTLRIAELLRAAGAVVSDGGIIGAPPRAGRAATRLYVSGEHAGALAGLAAPRLKVIPLGPGPSMATEMKILFSAANKGVVALMANVMAAAEGAGLFDAVAAEIDAVRPGLLAPLRSHAGELGSKAGRWAVEMEDVAEGLAALGAQPGWHRAAAQGYAGLSRAMEGRDAHGDDPLAAVLAAWREGLKG